MKNILITTLGFTENVVDMKYFYYQYENGQRMYCNGISVAEAGTKYILSQCKIDEIWVLASEKAVNKKDSLEPIVLNVTSFMPHIRIEDYSEYGFYQYRIQEYLNEVDFESQDILEILTDEEKQHLKEKVINLAGEFNINIADKELFYKIDNDIKDVVGFDEALRKNFNKDELKVLRNLLYSYMTPKYKLFPIEANKELTIKFINVEHESFGKFSTSFFSELVKTIRECNDNHIKTYIDYQGFGFSDAFSFSSLLSIMRSCRQVDVDIDIAGIIQTTYTDNNFTSRIIDEWRRFEIHKVLSAIDVFRNSGKTDDICEYIERNELDSPIIRKLLMGMQKVDEGISLCNVPMLQYGIKVINMIFEKEKDSLDLIYNLLKNIITIDYAKMMDGEEVCIVEMLKWAIRKKMFQQALSIVEALVPEDLVKRGIFFYAKDNNDIENIKKEINVYYWNETAKCRYVFNDIAHFMLKYYKREAVNYVHDKKNNGRDYVALQIRRLHTDVKEMLPVYTNLENEDLLYELLCAYMGIGFIRNKVCHAEPLKIVLDDVNEFKIESNMFLIEKALTDFVNIYEKACNKVKANGVVPVILTAEEFRSYATQHRLLPFENGGDGVLTKNCTCSFNGQDINISIHMLAPQEDLE